MSLQLSGRIVVVSPHPDDAVFSLGAALAHATEGGAAVDVLTVFAGDPDSQHRAGRWDELGGFATEGEAASARWAEDDHACEIIGATPVRLRFSDRQYGRTAPVEDVLCAVRDACAGADVVLVPGAPLANTDHALLNDVLLANPPQDTRLGLYLEQPYAVLAHVDTEAAWERVSAPNEAKQRKLDAIRAYASQLELLGGMRVILELLRYESKRGGESIRWLRG